ncbi:MAG: methylated-DNA--[protein]-cysteine S-methyltransferase [Pseudomonadales bacterium]|nr:methylated-DNA--[protein]-cysteine S-methyltransferase [Pseudomonadales bacterium]
MKYRYVESPIGQLLIAGDDDGLCYIGFPSGKGQLSPGADWIEDSEVCEDVRQQLEEYFAGERTTFDVRLKPHGTEFQLQVLAALQEIPFGETRSYRDIAERIGRPRAVRAVGAANGRNPIPIIIPCHRVVGADGSLTGFGGGLDTKAFLLRLEGIASQRNLFSAE